MIYRSISWWPGAYHVYDGDNNRIGVVNCKAVRINGKIDRVVWFAHNCHFYTIRGEFASRTAAAEAIPKGAIHQDAEALAGWS